MQPRRGKLRWQLSGMTFAPGMWYRCGCVRAAELVLALYNYTPKQRCGSEEFIVGISGIGGGGGVGSC